MLSVRSDATSGAPTTTASSASQQPAKPQSSYEQEILSGNLRIADCHQCGYSVVVRLQSEAAFDGLIEGLKPFMPGETDRDIRIKAINVWASVHGLVGILRRGDVQDGKSEDLEWIKNNLETYLEMTTFR